MIGYGRLAAEPRLGWIDGWAGWGGVVGWSGVEGSEWLEGDLIKIRVFLSHRIKGAGNFILF